jgi:hypothetical protein
VINSGGLGDLKPALVLRISIIRVRIVFAFLVTGEAEHV